MRGEFGKEGEAGRNIEYIVDVKAPGHVEKEISELLAYVDSVAEVHNTLRQGVMLKLSQ